jgi:arylsulfatase A-like enzyme
MDCAGHEFGDSPFFDKYTELTDKQIGRIWEAVKYREKAFDEEWMVVVTTDHGRNAIDGKGHGGQTQRERTTWISTNVKPNEYFKNNQPGIVDIVPSICRFMNFSIPRDVQFEQEGTPFIGKIDISNVKAEKKNNQIVITWNNYDNSPVEIYLSTTNNFKEGKSDEWIKVGKVKASQKRFVFDSSGINTPLCKFSVRSKNNMLPVFRTDQ